MIPNAAENDKFERVPKVCKVAGCFSSFFVAIVNAG
jgi:hypothetical protein